MAFVGMAQPSVPPAKSRRPVPASAAYLSNPGISCVLAEYAVAVAAGNAGAPPMAPHEARERLAEAEAELVDARGIGRPRTGRGQQQ